MYNVICIKHGTKYSPEYVNKLYSMVKRNLTLPHRFICFTEDSTGIDKNIEIFPFPNIEKVHGWWFKISIFQKQLYNLQGRTLYLDLDVVIVDNINCFFEFNNKNFCIIKDWGSRPNREYFNSSVFVYEIGAYNHLWDNFIMDIDTNIKTPGGDQIWITNKIQEKPVFWPNKWCQSYKYHCQSGIPHGSKIIIFHGRPNPHEVKTWNSNGKKYKNDWVENYWK